MNRQRTSTAIKKFSDDIRSFSSSMHGSLELLRRTIESGAHSGCHEFQEAFSEVEEEVADISNQLLQLELHVKEAISFEELLAHCAGVYDMNRKGLVQLETHLGQYGYRPQGPLQQPEDPITSATHAGNSAVSGENPRLTSDTSDDEVQHMDVDMHFDTACASMKGDGSPLAKSSYSQAVPGGTGGDSPGDAGVGGRHGLRGKKLAGISVAPTTPHYVMSQEAKARLKARVKTPGLPLGRRLIDDEDDGDDDDMGMNRDMDQQPTLQSRIPTFSSKPGSTKSTHSAVTGGVVGSVKASGILEGPQQQRRPTSPLAGSVALNEARLRRAASPVQAMSTATGRKATAAVAASHDESLTGMRTRGGVATSAKTMSTTNAAGSNKQRTPTDRDKGAASAGKASPAASTPDAFDMSPSFAALQAKYCNRQQQSTGKKQSGQHQEQGTSSSPATNTHVSDMDCQEATPLGELLSFPPANNKPHSNNSMMIPSWSNTDTNSVAAINNTKSATGYVPEEDTCNLYQQLIRSKDLPTSLVDANARDMAVKKQQAPGAGNSRMDPMRHSIQFPLQRNTSHEFATNQATNTSNNKEAYHAQQRHDAGTGNATEGDDSDAMGTPTKSEEEHTMTPTRLLRSRSVPRIRPDAALRASIGNADLAMRMEMLESTWVKSGQAALTPRDVAALQASPSRERIAQMVAQTTATLDGKANRAVQGHARKQLGELFNSTGTNSSGVASIGDRVEGATPQLNSSMAARYGDIMDSSGATTGPPTNTTTIPPGIISTGNTIASFSFLGDTPALPNTGCTAATNLTANFSPATAQLLGRVYGKATGSLVQSAALPGNVNTGTQSHAMMTSQQLSGVCKVAPALPTHAATATATATAKCFPTPSLAVEFSASLPDTTEIETPTLLKPKPVAQHATHNTTVASVQPSATATSSAAASNKFQSAASTAGGAGPSDVTAGNAAYGISNKKSISETEYSSLPMYIRITLPFDKLSSFYTTLCELSAGGGAGVDMTKPEALGLTGSAAKNLSSALTKLNKARLVGSNLVAL